MRKGPARVVPHYLKARYFLELPNAGRAFLKVMHGTRGANRRRALRLARREKGALRVLRGLAVPRLARVSPETMVSLLGFRPTAWVAQAHVEGKSMREAKINTAQVVGVWLFLAEQLAVFHRRGVLYTDLKTSNVLVQARPLRAIQIDFNFATSVRRGGSYPAYRFGYTAGYEAPEHGRSLRLNERAVVYQLGMLLAAALMGYDNEDMDGKARGREKLRGILSRLGSPGIGRLVSDCLSPRPEGRPGSYREVLERLTAMRDSGISPKSVAVWDQLRAPYAAAFEQAGLPRGAASKSR